MSHYSERDFIRPRPGLAAVVGTGDTAEDAATDAGNKVNEWLASHEWTTRDGLPPEYKPMQLEVNPNGRWVCMVVLFNFFWKEEPAYTGQTERLSQ